MKKKGKQYLLLIIVLGIWAAVGFRFFSYLSPEEESGQFIEQKSSQLTLENLKKEYSISCNYPDPFLKGSIASQKRKVSIPASLITTHNNKQATTITQTVKTAEQFPAVQLAGVIANKQSGKKSAIVVVDGKEYSLAAGETVNGIKLSKIFSDSIQITFQKKNKIIRL